MTAGECCILQVWRLPFAYISLIHLRSPIMRRLFLAAFICAGIFSVSCVSGSQPDQINQTNQSNQNSNTSAIATNPTITDGELRSNVSQELAADSRTSGHDINVEVSNGAVTLTGRVDSEETKAAATEAASRATKNVNNQLQATPEVKRDQAEVSDKDIQATLEKLVNQDEKISGLNLMWSVKNGVVSLDGVVDTNEQLGYAVQAISRI